MKLTDYVADFLARHGIRHAFVVSGGASIHLLHSVGQHPGIEPVCPHHEQAGAMAADAYARTTGGLGCAMGTSGPGATNLITGIAGAWFDSVPVLYLTGQVTTFRMGKDLGVRQFGFQETDIVPMVRPITKYAVQLRKAADIRYELEKAVHIARQGRPGPVLVDIPDDLQRAMVEPAQLRGFEPPLEAPPAPGAAAINAVVDLIRKAQRPVLIFGWGVRLAGAVAAARQLASRLNFPVLTSWAARDIMSSDVPHFVGTFGTHGTRPGNFTVQNADLVIAIGARLSTRETGHPLDSWAREAQTVVVDLDAAELEKFSNFGKDITLPIQADAGAFIEALQRGIETSKLPPIDAWRSRVADWVRRYPACTPTGRAEATVNPYTFIEQLAELIPESSNIYCDTGCTIAWTMQGFRVKPGQRVFHDFNNTAMGWALPAAIGGSLALDRARVFCLVGDGSFMMNLQELATVVMHRLPIAIFLLNNGGYSMVRQTEEQWFGGRNCGTSVESGLFFPDFGKIAGAFGIPYFAVARNDSVTQAIRTALDTPGPALVDVRIPGHVGVTPQARFGYPIEDSDPLLPRSEFMENMIVRPVAKSRER